jgi:hypothetical protein
MGGPASDRESPWASGRVTQGWLTLRLFAGFPLMHRRMAGRSLKRISGARPVAGAALHLAYIETLTAIPMPGYLWLCR